MAPSPDRGVGATIRKRQQCGQQDLSSPSYCVGLWPTELHHPVQDVAGKLGLDQWGILVASGLPFGGDLFFQHWILDPAGPINFAASDGLVGLMRSAASPE